MTKPNANVGQLVQAVDQRIRQATAAGVSRHLYRVLQNVPGLAGRSADARRTAITIVGALIDIPASVERINTQKRTNESSPVGPVGF